MIEICLLYIITLKFPNLKFHKFFTPLRLKKQKPNPIIYRDTFSSGMWVNVRGEPVLSVMVAGWFCEKPN